MDCSLCVEGILSHTAQATLLLAYSTQLSQKGTDKHSLFLFSVIISGHPFLPRHSTSRFKLENCLFSASRPTLLTHES